MGPRQGRQKIMVHRRILTFCSLFLILSVVVACKAPEQESQSGVQRSTFGTMTDGKTIDLYTLTNRNGMKATITTYGGRVVSLLVPDRNGKLGDVVIGFDDLEGYTHDANFFGALIGRYGNRIAKGRFKLDGVEYKLAINNGPNSLHGGVKGYDKVVWTGRELTSGGPGLEMSYLSKDGEEG
jgi:aldose 1-epimerase